MTINTQLLAALAAGVLLAGCATTAPGTAKTGGPSKAVGDSNCLSDTGTRIPEGDARCATPGRSYSSEDIARTGSTSAAEALRLLDPSITVHQ